MLLWPHMQEVLLGPVGFILLVWSATVVCLGITKRPRALSFLLVSTTMILVVLAIGAFQLSAKAYWPNRDMPLIASGLFITFVFGSFVCATLAIATWCLRPRQLASTPVPEGGKP